jgi:hypothetical protein
MALLKPVFARPTGPKYPKGIKERQRRGNLQMLDLKRKDCFASLLGPVGPQ